MQPPLEYLLGGGVVLVALILLLGRRTANPNVAAPPAWPAPPPDTADSQRPSAPTPHVGATGSESTHTTDPASSPAAIAAPPQDAATRLHGIIARLAREPSYRIDGQHPDCRALVDQGPDSLTALYDTVVARADTWVHLYPAMAHVAVGLGAAGRDSVAAMLRAAVEDHALRMVSFLDYVASKMPVSLCESLCDALVGPQGPVDPRGLCEAFGDAAAHSGKRAADLIIARLAAAPAEHTLALRSLLTALFSSNNYPKSDRAAWHQALTHRDARVRAAAAAAAPAQVQSQPPKPLFALAQDPDPTVRWAFVRHVEEIPPATLRSLAADPAPAVRAAALSQLDGQDDATAILTRHLDDTHAGVALIAAQALDHPSHEQRVWDGLHSNDPDVRHCAAQVAGSLPPDRYRDALAHLQKLATTAAGIDDLQAAVADADDAPDVLRCVAELAMSSPPIAVLRSAAIHLAFTNEEDGQAAAVVARLLDRALPARVRRAGFYAMGPRRAHWAQHLGPLLRPDEPLLPDLISELQGDLVGDDPVDHALFTRIQKAYPESDLAALADTALTKPAIDG